MKRSEMVDTIRMSLPWMNTTFANLVLNVIEKAGMLPPDLPRNKGTSYRNSDTGLTTGVYKWEPEDA